MSRIHVFATDWLPGRTDAASGGGLRSLQIVTALRAGGHEVTVSMPRGARFVQTLERTQPARARSLLLHDTTNQREILREAAPEVVFWLQPASRNIVFGDGGDLVHICDLHGLQDFESAGSAARALEPARARLRDSCRRADLVLTGSGEQYGYWLGELSRNSGSSLGGDALPPIAVVPYALPRELRSAGAIEPSKLRRLHFVGNLFPWSASVTHLARVAAWATHRPEIRLSLVCGIDPAFGTALPEIQKLRALEGMGGVEIVETISFGEAMDQYGAGSLHLELYDVSIERLLAVPIRAVNALTHGVPTLSNVTSALVDQIGRAGAGITTRDDNENAIEAALDRITAMPANDFAAMSAAARRLAEDAFSPDIVGESLCSAVAETIDRRARRRRSWSIGQCGKPPLGNVLVFTTESGNLRDLRVDLPLAALQRQRLISGYAVWSDGRLVLGGRSDGAPPAFDVLWVQRSAAAELALVMDALGMPFVYDIDDHLLTSPAYRPPFTPEAVQAIRGFIRSARVLSCSTGRLARHLQSHASMPLLHKTVVTPSLLRSPPPPRIGGEPNCVIWSSSDTPALTASRAEVLRAVRDFCLTHAVRLVCIGAPPPDSVLGGEVPIEHIRSIGYASYLDLLRAAAPAIVIGPLETAGDAATQEFVDSKSDIKLLEALGTGLVGVFSTAHPYLDSELPGAIFARNDYQGWFTALRAAREVCLRGTAVPAAFPPERIASGIGLMPWYEALNEARLPAPVQLSTITDSLAMLRARFSRYELGPDEFDAEFYMTRYPDIREAIEQGEMSTAYQHYARHGFSEGRYGRPDDNASGDGPQLWANLLHTVGDARQAIENRTLVIEDLKRRRDMRLRLRRAAL